MLLRTNAMFRRLWLGQAVSVVGDGVQRIALLWWAASQGGSRTLVAVALCTIVPTVAVSPFGGVAADRLDRRRLMMAADAVQAAICAALAILLITGSPSVAVVCVLVALTSMAAGMFDPAYAAAVPSVVGDADLEVANGLNMANSAVGGLVGPLVGGAVLGVWEPGWIVAVNAATFVWSMVMIAGVRLGGVVVQPAGAVLGSDGVVVGSGVAGVPVVSGDAGRGPGSGVRRVVADVRELRGAVPGDVLGVTGLAAVLNLAVAPVPLLLVALVATRSAGSTSLGALQASFGAGLLLGSLLVGPLTRRLGGGIAAPLFAVGVGVGALGSVPLTVSFAVAVATGVAMAMANATLIARLQRRVPAAMHGRAFGLLGGISEGLRPIGVLLAVPMIEVAGVRGAFIPVGALVAVATLLFVMLDRSKHLAVDDASISKEICSF